MTVSLGANKGEGMGTNPYPRIDFLGRSDCPKSPAMEKNLNAALKASNTALQYNFIDMASLPRDDYRRGYGTPTVLIDGEDLLGMPKPKPVASAPS
jgi:hypothetical protein